MATQETKAVEPTRTRENRIPVSGPRDILTVSDKDPSYSYRWVKDIPGRIQRFLDGGYEIVNHQAKVGSKTVDSGSKVGTAITRNDGAGTLVLMRIQLEWYNEDQERKMAQIDALEDSMRADGGRNDGLGKDRPDSGKFDIKRSK